MYLKRLEMKGFKSFADKVSLSLEPGISAIVGPNGSGKSNICDAILWVLGERNAKSLRGAIMEDVIFSGSSSRSAVNVAEVTLVLDNTDATLPLDYNEVSLSRRLYRSGESEYLINGVNSRRLDVLDILHDSGIGTDTNSIISQGHLDSILQSKPMDRRTLIEEAAGVLKHKQRKLRSQKKVERMEHNLERINDVMSEIERQLKPLRIKAKRAAAYDGLVKELSEVTLEIAVDDLKKIKQKWDQVNEEKKQIEKDVSFKKQAYEEKDNELAELRKKAASQSSNIVEYSSKQRKINTCIEKLNTFSILFNQKAQNAIDKYNTLNDEISENGMVSSAKKQILEEISENQEKLDKLKSEKVEIDNQLNASKSDLDGLSQKLEDIQAEYEKKNESQLKFQQELKDYGTKIKIAESLNEEKEKKELLDSTQQKFEDNRNKLNIIKEKFKTDNQILEDSIKQLNDINANILATEKMLEASFEESSDASKWLKNNKDKYSAVKSLSDLIQVPDKYISLVETLLGNYSSSYTANVEEISKINTDIKNAENANGSLRLVSNVENKYVSDVANKAKSVASKYNGVCLTDEVKISDNKIFGALANVVVFETSEEAFSASNNEDEICFASLDGTIIHPDGRYLIGSPFYLENAFDTDSTRTILSYKKNLEKLNVTANSLNKNVNESRQAVDGLQAEINSLTEKEIEYKNELATYKAEYEFSHKYIEELKSSLTTDYKDDNKDIETIKNELQQLKIESDEAEEWMNNSKEQLNTIKKDNEEKNTEYNNFVVMQAAISERIASQKENLESAKLRLDAQNKLEAENIEEVKYSYQVSKVYEILSKSFKRISILATNDLQKLDDNFKEVNKENTEIQERSDKAIEASNEARKTYDKANQQLSEIQVELGRLEIQVQHAVDAIDNIEGISVDKALEMPDIENRGEKEDRQFKLRRRIANMGTINPEAKQEYDTLKERYDFLNDQVEDLNAGKIRLKKIDKIIEERMKDDFINTFNEVNENFQQIFATLFPGGKAKLELETPDDLENSGVEVKAQPFGKSISKMSLLSGGEKSLVVLCLLFAVYKKRSTPFYILDEVEAALDDTNLRRLIKYLGELSAATQLIMITHQRRTMEMADVLYGVSMKNDGVTRVVSQRLDKDNKLHDIDK